MKLRYIKSEKVDIPESELQKLFEQNLESLDDTGLKYVGSYVPVGTGVIDTLAIDDDLNPVIIEYKRPGAFDRDALIQLMNYYGWFASDENHINYIRRYIRKVKPELLGENEDITSDMRLIAIVSDVEDDVKNACYAVEPSILLIGYKLSKHEDGTIGVIPHIVLDTSREYEREITPPKTIADHFKKRESMRQIYDTLEEKLKSIDPNVNPQPTKFYINFYTRERGRGFLGVSVTRSHLRLDFKGNIQNKRFKTWASPTAWGKTGEGGTLLISDSDQLDDEVVGWITKAYQMAKTQE
jgi:predicted transport protein